MIFKVRVRLGRSGEGNRIGRQLASMSAVLLTPAALVALVLATWRLGADLGWAGEFAVTSGLFSHWQVWMVLAAILQVLASVLNRYATGRQHKAHPQNPPSRPAMGHRPESSGVTRMPDPARRTRPGVKPDAGSIPRPGPRTYPVKDRTYF